MGCAEAPHYVAGLAAAPPFDLTQRLAIYALVARKSLPLLAPGLLLAAGLARTSAWRAARVAWLIPTAAAFTWLVADLVNHRTFGNHLTLWFALMADFDESPSPRALLEFGGNLFLPVVGALALYVALLLLFRGVSRACDLLPERHRNVGAGIAALALLALAAGPPRALLTERSAELRRLAFDLPGTTWSAGPLAFDAASTSSDLESALADSWRALAPRFARIPVDGCPAMRSGEGALPDIAIFVVESLRPDAAPADLTPLMQRWKAPRTLEHHASGANGSHLAIYEILFGRSSLTYDSVLDRRPRVPLIDLVEGLGYESVLASSVDNTGFKRLEEFLNDDVFDLVYRPPSTTKLSWPQRDREILASVRALFAGENRRPRFVFAYLMSTHYPYLFPKRYEKLDPDAGGYAWSPLWQTQWSRDMLRRRYAISSRFLLGEIDRTVATLDPERTLVIVLGDHGESFGEDGGFLHPGRASDVQTRTFARLAGAGITSGRVEQPSSHVDILPTVAAALGAVGPRLVTAPGRDLGRPIEGETSRIQIAVSAGEFIESVLVDGPRRLGFALRIEPPGLVLRGPVDDQSNPTPGDASPAANARWVTAFEEAIVAMTR